MLRKLRERTESEEGFTLVELLVVILIIGILAAIAIPSFLSQREKAGDAEAKSSVKSAQTAMETYFTDQNPGSYSGADATALEGIEETLVDADLTVNSATDETYDIQVVSDGGQTFRIVRADTGAVTRPCATAGDGGCPSGGGGW